MNELKCFESKAFDDNIKQFDAKVTSMRAAMEKHMRAISSEYFNTKYPARKQIKRALTCMDEEEGHDMNLDEFEEDDMEPPTDADLDRCDLMAASAAGQGSSGSTVR